MKRTLLAVLVLAGCNPNDFGGTMDRAPVQVIDRPSDFGSSAGRVLLPLPPPTDNPKVAGRLLFAGSDSGRLAVADFNGDGQANVQVVSNDDLEGLGVGAGISSMTYLASSGTVVLGLAENEVTPGEPISLGRVAFVRMTAEASGELNFSTAASFMNGTGVAGGHLGLAVAHGMITQGQTEEVVAVSDNGVSVLAPGKPVPVVATASCPGPFALPDDLYRALAVADFLKGGQQEIALGLPKLGGVGRVQILRYGPNPSVPELICDSVRTAPDVGTLAAAGFGASVAAVPDQDADGLSELLVGAPPDRAYLFFSGGVKSTMVFNKGDTVSEFGQRVALIDIDRDGIPEVAITALLGTSPKTSRAGEVFFYKLNGDGVVPAAVLYDSNGVPNKEFFGIGLADLEFNASRVCGKGTPAHVPVVGADKGLFAFFRFLGGAADPRCFAL